MTTGTQLVTLSDKAVTKIKEFFAQDKEIAGKALRVFVEQGGCSGNNYGFRFDDVTAQDTVQEYDGFKLVVDQQSGKLDWITRKE